jgi:hypothetical protein
MLWALVSAKYGRRHCQTEEKGLKMTQPALFLIAISYLCVYCTLPSHVNPLRA